jgi:TetR/AcrR family transcriptional regulator, cholesterol catabolism regulator
LSEELSAKPSRRERNRLAVRQRILESARWLFEEHGYEVTTVSEVVRHADIAYGTFFNHFPAKVDLLREVTDLALLELFEDMEEERKRPGHFADHLVTLFESSAARMEHKGPRIRELTGAMAALMAPQSVGQGDRRIRTAFRRILEDGLAAGELRADVDLETLNEVVVGSWNSIFLSWVHVDDYPLRERAASAGRFLAGALTNGGR